MTDKTNKLKMNLQTFADSGDGDSGNGGGSNDNGAGNGAGNARNGNGSGDGVTFTEQQQAVMNATIQSRIGAERSKWEKNNAQTIQDAVNQGIDDYKAKLNMSPEELAQLEKSEQDKELDSLKAQLGQRDRLDHARKVASEKDFPAELIEMVIGDSDEMTDKRIDETSKVLNKLVQASVEERLKGKETPGAGGSTANDDAGAYGKRLAQQYNKPAQKSSYF